MKRSLLFFFVSCMLCAVVFHFSACKEENVETTYKGTVVNSVDNQPFPNLEVKITDGNHINTTVHTNEAGFFTILVRFNEINSSYYLLIGDSSCAPVKREFKGFGQPVIDLGVIEVEGPKPPMVVTDSVTDINAESALCGGNVTDDGRAKVTRRGVVYSKEEYPSLEKSKYTANGDGKGAFQSQLTDLEYGTTYYVRAYATNRIGTTYGEQVSFTTTKGVALVITDSVYKVTAHTAKCKAHVESDGGFAITKRGTCWSTKPDPTIDDNITEDGSGLGAYSSTLKELVENTTYYVRAYATNSTSTVYGEQIIITTLDGLAVVQTDSVNTLKAASFTCYGNVLSDCDIPVTARGFVYATTEYPTKNDNEYTTSDKGLGVFKSTISKLEYGTTYYIRAYATNATATVYGKQISVTTLDGLPTVTTTQVTNIGSVKATCGGKVTDDGTLTVIARGVCYGTEQQPTIEGLHTIDGKGKGEFTSNLKELKDKTTYYVRAYATTDAGTAYGEQRTFKTADGTPTVELTDVGTPTPNSVTCSGNVTGDGGVTIIERGFCYSTSQYPTNQDGHVAIGNGLGKFTGTLNGLTVNTQYYVRAYVVNTIGVGYSEQQTFTTLDGMPVVTTAEPTAAATSINAGGEVTANGGYAVSERGVCYSTTNSEPTTNDDKAVSGKGNGTFKVAITGLTASTTYYVRAYAVNENGTAYGETHAIITTDGLATLTIGEIENITALSASGTVTVSDAGGATIQSCGICWATTPNPTIENNKATGGNQLNTTYTCNLTGLTPNTTYYVRGYVTTDATTTYSEQVTFKTATGLPELKTGTSTTTASSFTINSEVTGNGGYAVSERGICYSETNAEPTITDTKVSSGSGNGQYSTTVSSLTTSTNYYVRAYATNTIGTAYGEVITVTTKDGVAIVTTGEIANITALTASGMVTVTDAGGATLQSCGICWATTQNPTIENNKATGGNQLNTGYTCNMTELTPNTTYYVRAWATTDVKTTYGEQVTFATFTGLPELKTGTSTTTASSFTISSEVTGNGGYAVSERGICYSKTNAEPSITDTKVLSGSGNGTFKTSASGLTASTTYYVRSYATNSIGTAYGEVITVTTKDGAATISIGEIENIMALSASGNVTVTNAGGSTLKNCGICWATTQNPTIENNKATGGNQLNTTYTCNLKDLSPNTTYYVRAWATTDITTSYSEQVTFKTATGLPELKTGTATTTATSFTISSEVTGNGGYAVSERGICYSKTNAEPTITDTKVSSGSGNGTFKTSASGFTASTNYYVRAYATNSIGTSYGEVITVTTKDGAAIVTAGEIINITALTASGIVTVTNAGGSTLKNCGICWATTQNPTTENNKADGGNQLNTAYTCNMTELSPNTTYYVRAWATTDVKTTYSEQKTFKTTTGLPVLKTGTAATTATSFTISSEVTGNGGYAVSERGICYSKTNAEPTITDTKVSSGSGNGTFKTSASGLTASTNYYVRAYATNSIGTSYGEVITVTTKDGAAIVTAGEIINITALTASGIVTVTNAGGSTLKECGICWATTQNPTIENDKADGGNQLNTAYTCNMSELSPNTMYYVRAWATTDITTSYSEQVTFKTSTGLPALTTTETTATSTTILSGGTITSDGGYAITSRGVCYSTSNAAPTIADGYVTNGTGNGTYTCTITGVAVSTTYYVRAFATNSIGTTYGDIKTVVTGDGLPSVSTTPIGENVTNTTAIGGGQVIDDGGYSVTMRGVCWSTNPLPTTSDNKTTDGGGIGYYSSNITGINLTGSNIYYIRAYATNINGTAYGSVVKISKENLDYKNLPTLQYQGYTYKLYPDIGKMTWDAAMDACDNLLYGGFDDWYLPSQDELVYIMQNYKNGWYDKYGDPFVFKTSGAEIGSAPYWTSTTYREYDKYYVVYYGYYKYYSNYVQDEQGNVDIKSEKNRVRPIRKYKANQ